MATGGDHVIAAAAGGIAALPEECISRVISHTSPRVACMTAAVSPAFRAAADSDLVWERFLPPDCGEVLAQSVAAAPSPVSSKKELYRRLCDPVLIDDGKKVFWLERSTGKKCYMLSARDMVIVWGNTPRYWRRIPLPESRFKEAAAMTRVSWLELRGKIHRTMLSPMTTYAAYLVFKLAEDARGLSWPCQEAAIRVGSRTTSKGTVCLQPDEWESYWRRHPVRFRRTLPPPPPPPPPPLVADEQRRVPRPRGDGWMEVLIGELFSGEGKDDDDEDDDGEVDVSLMETTGGGWKSGLVVEGMEIRPAAGGVEPRSERAITCAAGTERTSTSTSRCTSAVGRSMDNLAWDESFAV